MASIHAVIKWHSSSDSNEFRCIGLHSIDNRFLLFVTVYCDVAVTGLLNHCNQEYALSQQSIDMHFLLW